jgi:hypothetical protein
MNARRALVAAALLAAVAVLAPEPAAANQVSAGSVELTPKIAFTHSNMKREGYGNIDNTTQFDFTPTIGFCLSDHYEVTGGAIVRHFQSGGTNNTNVGVTTGLIYNFNPKGSLIPYAGAGFGVLFEEGFTFDNTAVLAPDLQVGLRALVGNSASVNMGVGFQHESDGHVHVNRIGAQVGLSIFPWRTKK